MSDIVFILSGAIALLAVVLIVIIGIRGWSSSDKKDSGRKPRAVPVDRDEGGGQPPRRAVRNVRARMRAAAARHHDEEEEEEDDLGDDIALPDGKIGAKKRKKLEMKAEKRAQRERDLEDRKEKKERQVAEEQKKKHDELKEKEDEAKREEEERLQREEKERQEEEEYLKMKEAFVLEDEGFDQALDEQEARSKFQEFIDYIKNQKVVILEDLAALFKLKTQDCIDRVQDLLTQEQLIGVIDDRGKFIYITREELESVAKFIKQRGRILISELVESSNSLINLQHQIPDAAAKA